MYTGMCFGDETIQTLLLAAMSRACNFPFQIWPLSFHIILFAGIYLHRSQKGVPSPLQEVPFPPLTRELFT